MTPLLPEVTITTKSGLKVKQSQKLTPSQFVEAFLPFADHAEKDSGINKLSILAQAAWESGWNKSTPGWMFFGVKDTDGINGNEQLLMTHEFSKRADLDFPEIISVTPVIIKGDKFFKYVVMDYFRRYNSPAECFKDHAKFFFDNKRYKTALQFKSDPYRFIDEIAKAGYATGPNYADSLKSLVKTIQKYT
jgi:flagellum-specific peptidoglycan hydrolase FlgJ